jgi:histidinol phosphatase-like PHP family hydrolase
MFFAIGEISEIVNQEKEIRYDDLKELTRQKWLDDEPVIPLNMYPDVFEKAYKNLLELNMIREEIRDLAGVETKYVIISKLPFLKDMKRTFKFISFILKLYFWKKNTNMNKEVSNNE